MKIVKSKSHIYVLDNVISDELCQTIKTIIDNTKGSIEEHGPGSNVQAKSVRIHDLENQKFAQLIDKEIHEIVENIAYEVVNSNPLINNINGDCGYNLRRISGKTRIHSDTIFMSYDESLQETISPRNIRKLSLIIALNGDYEGGEFVFPDQNIQIKLKKGQAILFPPYWTHPHSTNNLYNNTSRYTINTWLCE